jgi:hypothetical protein
MSGAESLGSAVQHIEVGQVLRSTYGTLFRISAAFAKTSIRVGTRPSWINCSDCRKSDSLKPDAANPNSFKISTSTRAFSGVDRTKIIKIAGVTWPSVQGHAICTDDDLINAAGV